RTVREDADARRAGVRDPSRPAGWRREPVVRRELAIEERLFGEQEIAKVAPGLGHAIDQRVGLGAELLVERRGLARRASAPERVKPTRLLLRFGSREQRRDRGSYALVGVERAVVRTGEQRVVGGRALEEEREPARDLVRREVHGLSVLADADLHAIDELGV